MKIFFIVLASAIIIALIIIPIFNNNTLNNFSAQLYNIELPDNTVLIEKFKINGNLNGNGNTMDFLACILVKSDLSQKELYSFLKNANFQSAKSGGDYPIDKEVIEVSNRELKTKYLERDVVVFQTLQKETNYEDYYALIIYDGGYSAHFDIRGH